METIEYVEVPTWQLNDIIRKSCVRISFVVKSTVKILSIFVAFLENMNFKTKKSLVHNGNFPTIKKFLCASYSSYWSNSTILPS